MACGADLIHGEPIWHMGNYLVILLIEGIICVPLGLWIFSRAERYAKRTGKLKRNG